MDMTTVQGGYNFHLLTFELIDNKINVVELCGGESKREVYKVQLQNSTVTDYLYFISILTHLTDAGHASVFNFGVTRTVEKDGTLTYRTKSISDFNAITLDLDEFIVNDIAYIDNTTYLMVAVDNYGIMVVNVITLEFNKDI